MGIITYEEVYRTDGFNVLNLAGTGRLAFEAKYEISVDAIKTGDEDRQRYLARQQCKKAIVEMLKDAIAKLEEGK